MHHSQPGEIFGKDDNEDAVRKELAASQLKISKFCYETRASIDQHKHHKKDTLRIEKEY